MYKYQFIIKGILEIEARDENEANQIIEEMTPKEFLEYGEVYDVEVPEMRYERSYTY